MASLMGDSLFWQPATLSFFCCSLHYCVCVVLWQIKFSLSLSLSLSLFCSPILTSIVVRCAEWLVRCRIHTTSPQLTNVLQAAGWIQSTSAPSGDWLMCRNTWSTLFDVDVTSRRLFLVVVDVVAAACGSPTSACYVHNVHEYPTVLATSCYRCSAAWPSCFVSHRPHISRPWSAVFLVSNYTVVFVLCLSPVFFSPSARYAWNVSVIECEDLLTFYLLFLSAKHYLGLLGLRWRKKTM